MLSQFIANRCASATAGRVLSAASLAVGTTRVPGTDSDEGIAFAV